MAKDVEKTFEDVEKTSEHDWWSEADLSFLDDRFEVISRGPDADGRIVIVGGGVVEEHPEWLQLVGFQVRDSRMDLVVQTIMRTPTEWTDPVLTGRNPILAILGEQIEMESTTDGYLTTSIIRSAAVSDLEVRVRHHLAAREWDGRTTAETLFGATVDVGLASPAQEPASKELFRLAEIARRYVELCRQTTTPRPILMQEFGLANNTIQSYLHKARKAGLLTSPERSGVVGGELTRLAKQVLSEAESSGI
jgi:hypothetical protein